MIVSHFGRDAKVSAEEGTRKLCDQFFLRITFIAKTLAAFRSGQIRSFNYAYLSEVEFQPGDTITVKFTSGAAIVIEGRGLAYHRQQIRQHRADEIRECTESELQLQEEGISQVEKIFIVEGDTSCYDNSASASGSPGVAGATQHYSLEISGGSNVNCGLSFQFQ